MVIGVREVRKSGTLFADADATEPVTSGAVCCSYFEPESAADTDTFPVSIGEGSELGEGAVATVLDGCCGG